MLVSYSRVLLFLAAFFALPTSGSLQATASSAATATVLTVTTKGGAATTVASGNAVTLLATVSAGTQKVTTGLVNFCDASVAYCTDIHMLGAAQLTSAGTATLKFVPPPGAHSYKAVFVGTKTYAGSRSSAEALSVTGLLPSVTALTQYGGAGDWQLTATVGGSGSSAPTGKVSFLDASTDNTVLGTATLGVGTAGLTFLNSGVQYNFAPNSNAINLSAATIGDMNGDGFLDILSASGFNSGPGFFQDAGVTALLGDGNGNFNAAPTANIGGNNVALVAVGDFNGDGILDTAVGGSEIGLDASELIILLGKGDGTFTLGQTLDVGTTFSSFVVGDFNQDGIPDLAVASTSSNLVNVFIGNGDGTFTASTAAPASIGASPVFMAIGDINGDNLPDLAITTNPQTDIDSTVTILLGNGDGTFTKAATLGTGMYSTFIALGDFNQDGRLDIGVVNDNDGTVDVLLGNGNGGFSPAPGSPITVATYEPQYPQFLAAGDFNGDGKLDLLLSDSQVLLGKGDGTFVLTNSSLVENGTLAPTVVAVADFNGDGLTDFATFGSAYLSAMQTASATATGIAVTPGTGSQPVLASYAGDSHYNASESGPESLNAALATPPVVLTPSADSVNAGSAVTLTATVTSSGIAPTGTVTFYDGSAQLGTSTLNASGVATYATSSLAAGSHSLTASYGGDVNDTPANSAVVVLTVTAPPAISIPPPASVAPGSSVAATATIAAGSTYLGTLNLTCSLTDSPAGAQSLPTCSLKPTSVALTSGGSATSVLTVLTTAASTSAQLRGPSGRDFGKAGAEMTVLALLLVCGIPARRRRWISMLVVLWLVVTSAAIGCGGGVGAKGTTTPATTAGTYTFTLTGTDSANATITISSKVTVTVN